MTVSRPSSDTAHLYDGKTVRSSAPSRKKAAGQVGVGSEIPKDAIPQVEIPTFIESLLGGPLVPKTKFLPPDKMVQNLQLGVYGVLVALSLMTYIISPPDGTIWYMLTGSLGLATILQLVIIAGATGTGFWGTFQRDGRFTLVSNLLFILAILRFASSKVTLSSDMFGLQDKPFLLSGLVVVYAVLLINPIIATILATIVLSANSILPFFVGIFSKDTATRMEESVELISVYGVALGTFFVFSVVGGLFALNLPTHLQSYREKRAED